MRVVVPFGADRPKTRLDPVLDADERAAFARAMLRDVLVALRSLDCEPAVLADAPLDVTADGGVGAEVDADAAADSHTDVGFDVPVTVDERPLTAAVNGVLPSAPDDEAVAVVMADLALATSGALSRLFGAGPAEAGPDARAKTDADGGPDVVLAPGRGGGTNALLARDPAFHVDYHGASVRDHRRVAMEADLDLAEVDSYRLATDVDEPADLVEVLLHAPPDSAALAWLEAAGFELAVTDGRASARR